MNAQVIRCAIYVRRSTDQHQEASIEVQLEQCQRYLAAKGWQLAPEHIYIDDAISRAEFKKRPGLIAMLNAAEEKRFDVVVTRDETRLGGDTYRTGIVIQDLLDHGVKLVYYFTDEEVRLDGAIEKFLVAARNFASELEREKISQRVHEHLLTKARRGLNVGGRVYGYDNVEVKDGDRRVCVDYAVNAAQAKIVQEIFRRYAKGEGLRGIAKDLNARGVEPPKAGRRGTGSWSYASIREMLGRDRYRGVLIWGRTAKAYRGGTKVRNARTADGWVRVERPDLRIIDDELWGTVQRLWGKRVRLSGAERRGTQPRYLLSGMGRCALCGGPIVTANSNASGRNVRVYVCKWHRDRGRTVCQNLLRRPVVAVNQAVLAWMTHHVLSDDLIAETLRELRQRLAARTKSHDSELPEIRAQIRGLKAEIDRLGKALAATDDAPAAVVKMIADREERVTALELRLLRIQGEPSVLNMEARRIEKEARKRLSDFAELMERHPVEARRVLESLLTGPLRFVPVETAVGRRWRVEGEVGLEAMVVAEVSAAGGTR